MWMLITFYLLVIGLVIVGVTYLLGGVTIALCCAVGFAALVLAVAGLARYRSARRFCPVCGANHPRMEDLISDGGIWMCRKCGNTW